VQQEVQNEDDLKKKNVVFRFTWYDNTLSDEKLIYIGIWCVWL